MVVLRQSRKWTEALAVTSLIAMIELASLANCAYRTQRTDEEAIPLGDRVSLMFEHMTPNSGTSANQPGEDSR